MLTFVSVVAGVMPSGVTFAEDGLSVKDAYVRYSGFDYVDGVTLGHFKEPFPLEDQTSGKQITFMDRASPVDAFSPGRAFGLGVNEYGKSWSLSGGLFAEVVGDTPANDGNEGWGAAARGTVALYRGARRNLHLGAAGAYREPDSRRRMRYRVGAESHLITEFLIDTGNINTVEYTQILGLEAAVVEGPFSVQGEYIQTHVERDGGNPGLDFDGWYLSGSWLLTGESRPYSTSDGSFDQVIPKGEWGAWELGLRYSKVDLNDQSIMGGAMNSTTFGLNWYVNPRIRFMANYILTESESGGVSDDPNIFQIRSQLVF